MEEDLEFLVYQRLCSQCPNARKCHEECATCERYNKELEGAQKYANTKD